MSAYVIIECDKPDCAHAHAVNLRTIALARQHAVSEGWERRNGRDYCPAHAASGGVS